MGGRRCLLPSCWRGSVEGSGGARDGALGRGSLIVTCHHDGHPDLFAVSGNLLTTMQARFSERFCALHLRKRSGKGCGGAGDDGLGWHPLCVVHHHHGPAGSVCGECLTTMQVRLSGTGIRAHFVHMLSTYVSSCTLLISRIWCSGWQAFGGQGRSDNLRLLVEC
jgi:hypothetical protein